MAQIVSALFVLCFSIFVATAVAWVSGSFEKFLVQIEKLFYVDQNVLKPTFLDF